MQTHVIPTALCSRFDSRNGFIIVSCHGWSWRLQFYLVGPFAFDFGGFIGWRLFFFHYLSHSFVNYFWFYVSKEMRCSSITGLRTLNKVSLA